MIEGPFARGGRLGAEDDDESCWGFFAWRGRFALGPRNLIIGVLEKVFMRLFVSWFIFEINIYN